MTRLVELPLEIDWSGPFRPYDLDDPKDRHLVYTLVLQEGNVEHVRQFVDVDELLAMWDDLFLPANVEAAWADYFERIRGVKVRRRWGSRPSKSA